MKWPVRELDRQEFPPLLSEIPGPPGRLWLRGELPPPGHKCLAVVGSRAITGYGRQACKTLIGGLAGYPVSIVSGLALGTDAAAHEAALDAGLHTLAIPGSGIEDDVLYPSTNRGLAKRILEAGGGLMSEFPPDSRATRWGFPKRNRIMAGIADAVLVIEAGERSGTLITARLAGEYNRELLCVPHEIGSPHGFGSHLFIRLGAELVSDPKHILEALRLKPREESGEAPPELEGAEREIYDLLEEPAAHDEIIRALRLEAKEALAALVMLELRGVLKKEFGKWRRM
ncbi:MAG: DNA-processing protein DprA [bacterium]